MVLLLAHDTPVVDCRSPPLTATAAFTVLRAARCVREIFFCIEPITLVLWLHVFSSMAMRFWSKAGLVFGPAQPGIFYFFFAGVDIRKASMSCRGQTSSGYAQRALCTVGRYAEIRTVHGNQAGNTFAKHLRKGEGMIKRRPLPGYSRRQQIRNRGSTFFIFWEIRAQQLCSVATYTLKSTSIPVYNCPINSKKAILG